jgi:putative ABC transport system substrate-binding protein
MDRRSVIGCLAALSASRAAGARPANKIARIGIITSGFTTAEMKGPNPGNATIAAVLRGMRELGYEYGKDFVTDPRGGEGRTEQFASLAAELVQLPADVIVAGGPTLPAVMGATSTIPVVMVGGALDLVKDGFARVREAGGNITGLSFQQVDTTPKRLEILRLVPTAPVAALGKRQAARRGRQETAARVEVEGRVAGGERRYASRGRSRRLPAGAGGFW